MSGRTVGAALVTALLAITLASAAAVPAAAAPSFRDVPRSHQFREEITWLADMRVTTGYADGTFKPRDSVTREAFAAFLYRLAGSPRVTTPSRSPFRDVPTGAKFYDEIVWLDQQGITNGWSDGTFRPKLAISREAIAAFLYRLAGKPSFTAPSRSPFRDVSRSAQFYREVTWLADSGITTGYADGTFKPRAKVERQAIAAFLYRGSAGLRGSGTYDVGKQVFPGTYVAAADSSGWCEWEVHDYYGNYVSTATPVRGIATIEHYDRRFLPSTCGQWRPLRPTSPRATSFGDGTFMAEYHMRPGTYEARGGATCYWAVFDGFAGRDVLIDESYGAAGTQRIRVKSGQGVATTSCGTWKRIGS